MNNSKILSICIPTYNRGNRLISLISSLLECKSNEFEIEITDNASNDGTIDKIQQIQDERIIIHQNEKNIGGAANMIKSIFNVRNKYAFYCNDRDTINNEQLLKLIEFLKKNEFSYIKVLESKYKTDVPIKIYKKGVDSIIHQNYTFHPTGCIFNCNMIRKMNFNPYEYIEWEGTEKYCRLAWDLMCYGNSATVEFGVWEYAHLEYYAYNISGFRKQQNKNRKSVYFHPAERTRNMKLIMHYLLKESKHLKIDNNEERGKVALSVIQEFYLNIPYYKYNTSSKYETLHYQIKPYFVSTVELLILYKRYYEETIEMMKYCDIEEKFIFKWKKDNGSRILLLIKKSLLYDIIFVKKMICCEKW